jgi:hypothetical protein
LYQRLQQRARTYGFGEVLTVHENEEMVLHYEESERPGRKSLVADIPGEYYRVNCPFCHDTRHRLWINYRWGRYDEQSGTQNLWLCVCYNENCLNSYGMQKRLYDMVFDDVSNGRQTYDPLERGEKQRIIREAKPAGTCYPLHALEVNHPAVLYLRSRGYDTEWLSRELDISYCVVADPDYRMAAHRIIIPMIMRCQLVGWQARLVGDSSDKAIPKYYTMPGMVKKQVLYNFDVAKRYPFVVLTEGATKVWSVGPEGVAQLGDKLSSFQASIIAATWDTAVIYLDGNAFERASEAYYDLKSIKRVLIRLPEDKEPGDFTLEYNRALIYNEAKKQGIDLPMGS